MGLYISKAGEKIEFGQKPNRIIPKSNTWYRNGVAGAAGVAGVAEVAGVAGVAGQSKKGERCFRSVLFRAVATSHK